MNIAVFLGPTMPLNQAKTLLDAHYLPPAAQGDIFRILEGPSQPRIIAIIDGYFQAMPAVRHKEILWALDQGVHVFGAASMGALRASELAAFGMCGVGAIFEAYRDGLIEDDDEVAVLHGPAELGYAAMTDAMVNIRATFDGALARGVISPGTRDALIASAKSMNYRHRSFGSAIDACAAAGANADELSALRSWLERGKIDQKRDDAESLLRILRAIDLDALDTHRPTFSFEASEIWLSDMGGVAQAHDEGVLDEVRLVPDAYRQLRRDALTLALALRTSRHERFRLDEASRQMALNDLGRDLGLADQGAMERWREDNHLDARSLERLIDKAGLYRRVEEAATDLIDRQLIDTLRLNGRYGELAKRARRKAELADDLDLADMPAFSLVAWYAAERLQAPPPADLHEFAAALGFADLDALVRALRLEYALGRDCRRSDSDRLDER